MKQTYSIVATNYCGPKAPEVLKSLKPGDAVTLVREPDNPADKNAVAVYFGAVKIGYVPKAKNAVLAQFIEQHGKSYDIAVDEKPSFDAGAKIIVAQFSGKAIDAIFKPSPNSGFPQVEVG